MEKKHISAYQNAGLKKNRLTKRTGQARVSAYVRDDKSDKNRGGILGGAGYIAGSLGLGAAGVAEGIGDLVSAGADLIRGDTDMAKYRFLDNQTGEAQQRLVEAYNPGTIMKGAGDVASGIGSSLTFMIPYVGPYLAGAGYVGMGISSAAEQTGDVGMNEITYGALTGGSELLMDMFLSGAGQAAKNIGASITRKVGRKAAESGAKATAKLAGKSFGKSVLKETLTGAAGEAAEEAVQEAIDPFLLQLFNIDDDAEFDLGRVAYAGLIGGLSGGLMTAGPAAINYKSASKAGKAIRESGETEDFLRYTEQVLSGAKRKIGKYQAEREAVGSKKADEAVGALGKVKSAVGGTVSSIRSKRAEKRITDMAKKVGDNLDTYKQYLNKADKTAKELEISDAVLGELRGNVFLLENASLLESYEEAIISEDETVKQALVDDFNRRAKEGGGEKFDYTVADLEANADDILTAIAGRYMMEDAYGPYMKRSERSKRQENASDSAEVAREGAKEAGEEQTADRDETGDTGTLEGSEAGSWDAVTNESAKVYGAQTPDEKALLDAAVSEGVPEKSIKAMIEGYRAGTSLSPQEFAEAWKDGVILFGKYNVDEGGIDPESALGRMEESSRRAAIQYGRAEAEAERGKAIRRAEARKKAAAEKGDGKKAVRHPGINLKSDLNDAQFSAYKAAEIMASAIHADIEIRKNLERAGKRINGYYDPDTNTLVINISAMRDGRHIALYTLGHEVTHYIRQWSPEKFYEMGDFVMNKLGDGAEKAIREKLTFLEESGLLQGKTASDAYALAYEEVVAEGMEGVLADGVVLEELSRADKTLWEKIKDRIAQIIGKVKKAYGELKGTSRTAQILSETMDSMEELEQLFYEGVVEAGRGNRKTTEGKETEVRYSLPEGEYDQPITKRDIQKLRDISEAHGGERVSINDFTREDIEASQKWAYKFYQEIGTKSPFFRAWFGDWRAYDQSKINTITVNNIDIEDVVMQNGDYSNADTGWSIRAGSLLYGDTVSHARGEKISVKALNDIENILENAVLLNTILSERDKSKKSSGTAFMHKLYCPITYKGELYIAKITVEEYSNAEDGKVKRRGYNLRAIKIEAVNGSLTDTRSATAPVVESASIDSISDLFNFVKSYDKEFSPKPVNPVLLNEDGTPKVFYHGTRANFTTFELQDKPKYGRALGDGFYFTSSYEKAFKFANGIFSKGQDRGGVIMPVYLRMQNPYVIEANADRTKWINEYHKGDYDGIIDVKNDTYYVEGQTQIKSATDNIGTFDSGNSDIRYSIDDGEGDKIPDVSKVINEYTRLADAFEDSVVSEKEYKIIKQYRERAYAMEQADQRLKALRREAASINREIEALSERIRGVEKARRDAWVVTALDEAKKRKSRILEEMNQISKSLREDMDRLLSLQAAEPIRRAFGEEKKRADAMERKAERAEMRTEEKNRQYKEKVDRMMEESEERGEITTRKRTVMRVLGSLQTKLYHPTKTNHVPKELHDLAMKTLEAADPGAFGKNRNNIKALGELAAKIERLERKAARTALEQKNLDDWKYRYERLSEETISLRKQAEAMLTAFVEYNKQAPEALRYPEPIIELMTEEVKKIEQVPMYQMGLESLKAVETFVTMVNHHVTKANELFAAEREKTVSDAGDAAIQETLSHKALKFLSPKAMELKGLDRIRRFFWKNMKPLTVFEAIGSDTFTEIFQRVIDSEAVWAQDILEARGQILAAREKFGYDSWDLKERRAVETKSGTVELSLSEIMSLYAYSFREQALGHLEGGGFVLDPNATATVKGKTMTFAQVERRLNNAQRYVMDAQEMGNLASLLTEQQKSYVQQMQQYLTSLGEKGNTVSRKLYGIDLFTEKYYFPIKVKSEYLQSQTGPSGDPNIKSRGHTKQVVPNADNPLVLQDFDRVMSDHINSMATYHAFVLPIEDLTRVLNYKPSNVTIDDDGNWIEDDKPKDYSTLKAVIESKYGEQANAYIVQLIRDLNGGARRDAAAGLLDRGITAFKRASTMLSMSVTIQQPTSLVRAMAYIDPRYFASRAGLDFKHHKELWEIVKKYAPVAIIKEMGGYDTGVGTRTGDYLNAAEYKTFGEKFGAFIKPERFGGDANYRSEVFGAAAAYADEMAWIQIFQACVNEQADMMKKPHDSEEVLRAAGKRFEEVIRRTQVYDSTLTRSEYMRSKDTGMKMATAFMAEPTTVASMVADALIRAERGDKKFLRRTAGAIGGAILANSLLVSLVYALRDDDEDETYTEKYLSSLVSELTEGINPAGYLPVFRDIMSIMQGYEVERSDMTLIQNLYDQIQNITSSKRSVADKMFGVSGAVSAFFGVPVSNVYRDAKGIMNTFIGQVDTETTTGKGVSKALKEEFTTIFGLFDKQTTNQYQLYQAAVSGDTKHFNRVAARYESEKDVEMALRKALRENDRRIAEAARARMDGELDIYKSMIEKIEGEGHFDRDIIIRAINNEMTAIKREEEAGGTVPRDEDADAADEYASESIFTSSDLNDALERGDHDDYLDVYATLLSYKKEQGKTEAQAKASIKSSITAYWKKKYIAAWAENNQAEIKRIQSIILSTGLYGTRNDVAELGQEWVKNYANSKTFK